MSDTIPNNTIVMVQPRYIRGLIEESRTACVGVTEKRFLFVGPATNMPDTAILFSLVTGKLIVKNCPPTSWLMVAE